MDKEILTVVVIIMLVVLFAAVIKDDNENNINNGTGSDISKVRVAAVYEKVTDRDLIGGRTLEDTIKLLKQTNTDFIFRGFWQWAYPVVEFSNDTPPEVSDFIASDLNIKPEQIPELIKRTGNSYEELANTISAIKKELPGVIFTSAVPAQMLARIERNPISGKVLGAENTWNMALDPAKWGIEYKGKPLTKEEFQKSIALRYHYIEPEEAYDWRKVRGYQPDITNPDFQKLLLSWAEKQVDSGADGIWIDGLDAQTDLLYAITKNHEHPAIKESLAASSKIVDDIHEYGISKGKKIYVGGWVTTAVKRAGYPESSHNYDFVTTAPSPKEVMDKKLNKEQWDKEVSDIRKIHGNIPVFAFIDWGYDGSQLEVFSQNLSKEEQAKLIGEFDDAFASMNITFAYPLHGGFMGGPKRASVLAFGKYRNYDSLAPEFGTYDTIKELANKKTIGE